MGNGQSGSHRRPTSNPPRTNLGGAHPGTAMEAPPPVAHRPPTPYYGGPPPQYHSYQGQIPQYFFANGMGSVGPQYYGQNPYGQAPYTAPSNTNLYMNYRPIMVANMPVPHLQPPVPEPQRTSTIRNDVNLKRATLRLEPDPENAGQHLVAFSFDATVAGSVCIFFLSKEGEDCSFKLLKPDKYKPVRVKFDKGLGQKFRQEPGTGVDLSLFSESDLSKEGKDNVFPLVVRTETVPRNAPEDAPPRDSEPPGAKLPKWVQSQTTYAVLEKKDEGWAVKVLKQKIWVDGMRYELQEIYGIEQMGSSAVGDAADAGKECVICMSEPRDTTVLPCRHMCMCSECAKVLRFQTNRCPICRCVVERLLEIKMEKGVEPQVDTLVHPGAARTAPSSGASQSMSTADTPAAALDGAEEAEAASGSNSRSPRVVISKDNVDSTDIPGPSEERTRGGGEYSSAGPISGKGGGGVVERSSDHRSSKTGGMVHK